MDLTAAQTYAGSSVGEDVLPLIETKYKKAMNCKEAADYTAWSASVPLSK